jgi:hypothetical protein
VWHLTFRVPLNFAAIPEAGIKAACERFGMSLDTWQRQERAFGLLRKVYAKRAKLRGEQPLIATAPMTLPEPGAGNDAPTHSRAGSPWSMPAGAEAPRDARRFKLSAPRARPQTGRDAGADRNDLWTG